MKITGIRETCLYISSIARTKSFYHGLLQLEVHSTRDAHHIFFRAGADMLLCFVHGTTARQHELPPHHARGQIHFAFEVPEADYEQWKNRVRNAGITIEHEQEWTEKAKSFYFRDPDMHSVEIITPGLWD